MKVNYEECHRAGGFWLRYGIHAEEFVQCRECEDEKCPYILPIRIVPDNPDREDNQE